VGGVDSMMEEKKIEKNSLHRFLQEMLQEMFLWKRSAAPNFIAKKESISIQFYLVGT